MKRTIMEKRLSRLIMMYSRSEFADAKGISRNVFALEAIIVRREV